MAAPRVAIIIPSWSGQVDRVRASIEKQTFKDYSLDVIQGVSPAARARNIGAGRTTSEILLFIDDDAYFGQDDSLEVLVNLLDNDPSIAVAGTSKLIPPLATPLQRAISQEVPRMIYPVVSEHTESNPPLTSYGFTAISTTCCAVKRDIFEQVGGFDEKLLTSEDTDFFYRVHKTGYKIFLAGNCWVYHDPPATIGALIRKSFRYGLSHAQEARKNPERGMKLLPIDRWYGKLLIIFIFLGFPLMFFVHYYFDPQRKIVFGFRPVKTISTYAVLCGYCYGWLLNSPWFTPHTPH